MPVGRLAPNLLDTGHESIALSCNGLNVPGVIGVVVQRPANFAYRRINGVVSIQGGPLAPDGCQNLLASHETACLAGQQEQQFHGDSLQLHRTARASELKVLDFKFELLEADSSVAHSPVSCTPYDATELTGDCPTACSARKNTDFLQRASIVTRSGCNICCGSFQPDYIC
jgi:hypothetical protein